MYSKWELLLQEGACLTATTLLIGIRMIIKLFKRVEKKVPCSIHNSCDDVFRHSMLKHIVVNYAQVFPQCTVQLNHVSIGFGKATCTWRFPVRQAVGSRLCALACIPLYQVLEAWRTSVREEHGSRLHQVVCSEYKERPSLQPGLLTRPIHSFIDHTVLADWLNYTESISTCNVEGSEFPLIF